MPSERTLVTELATALGMVGPPTVDEVLARRPASLSTLDPATWVPPGRAPRRRDVLRVSSPPVSPTGGPSWWRLTRWPDGSRRRIEWTGGHRLPGDEAVPLDLRIDHVYLVSCKYLSKVLQNAGPARLAEGLLTFRRSTTGATGTNGSLRPNTRPCIGRHSMPWGPRPSRPGHRARRGRQGETLPVAGRSNLAGGNPGGVPGVLSGRQHRDRTDLEELPPPLRDGGDAVAAAADRIGPVLRAR